VTRGGALFVIAIWLTINGFRRVISTAWLSNKQWTGPLCLRLGLPLFLISEIRAFSEVVV
jgi:hypothetical protein